MTEFSNADSDDFRFQIREITRIVICDYKDNKKDKFLCEYLANNRQHYFDYFALLDCEKGTKGVITKGDINIFLSSKDIKKKKSRKKTLFIS